ncbi:MAG: hypothetical protein K0Q55_675 [Verrucomicrobia bacterium]|jgi:hypothetical protein|nr:hypothetical protein [Verrucomicrobiota bacterium]
MPTLTDAIQILTSAAQAESSKFTADQYVEVRRTEHEMILGGNRNGLIWIALQCLELAERGQRGSHIHLDQHSGADVCEGPLVIRHWTPEES